ncbi:tRNAse Z TRZ4, mitochondrial-like isoform X2 [Malania oleifera]|uniref:tRNAse Z TRZ4, mitochondrial-like isoform X2 n=1 Tax=Malania oleifera TaxID=397392 RepID=UPI0025AE5F37|nr:tRNAse Z TRZ4, mitochondrial-like isoform X2 [Malania oleifera]
MVKATQTYNFSEARAEGMERRGDAGKPKKKLQRNDRSNRNTPAYVQILGTGMDTHDTLPSVLLFFDEYRFIFNAGEGLQRFCAEHKIKLSKIDHICLTRACSETAGGLPGLLLTLAGMGEGMSVNIWGPPNLKLLVEAVKSFVPHDAIHANSSITCIENQVVNISLIPLQPSCLQGYDVKPSDISMIYVCELHKVMGKFYKEKAEALGLTVKKKYGELQKGASVKSDCLDIMVHPIDVMDPPVPGPIVIIVDCPTVSHAQELLSMQSLNDYYSDYSPENTKTVNCVIHLSPASVVSSPNYEKWMKKFGSAQHIMAGHAMKHVDVPILKSSTRVAARLNYLCPQFFPTPAFWSVQNHNNVTLGSIITSNEGPVLKPCQSIFAENLLKFTLRPYANLGLDKSSVPSPMASSEIIAELLSEIPDITDAAQLVSQFWHKPGETNECITGLQDTIVMIEEPMLDGNTIPSCLENIRRDDLEIVFLGTGSSQPSKYRNVSSVYINLFSKGSLLLDCGEGTLAQLKRRYGMKGGDNAVRNLRCIWISHIHADHHAGLVRILALRRDLLKEVPHEPLLVIGPMQLAVFLCKYQILEDLDMQFLDCRNTVEASWNAFGVDPGSTKKYQFFPGNPINGEDMNNRHTEGPESKRLKLSYPIGSGTAFPLLEILKKILNDAGLERLISVPVVHCPEAFGIVLKAAERVNSIGKVIPGWKLVYSGDTRPCQELMEASQGATILIHEASNFRGLHGG